MARVELECEKCGNEWRGKHPDDRNDYGKPVCPSCQNRGGVVKGDSAEADTNESTESDSQEVTEVTADDFMGDSEYTDGFESDETGGYGQESAESYDYAFGNLTIRDVSLSDSNVQEVDGTERAILMNERNERAEASVSQGDLYIETEQGNFIAEPEQDGNIYMVVRQI